MLIEASDVKTPAVPAQGIKQTKIAQTPSTSYREHEDGDNILSSSNLFKERLVAASVATSPSVANETKNLLENKLQTQPCSPCTDSHNSLSSGGLCLEKDIPPVENVANSLDEQHMNTEEHNKSTQTTPSHRDRAPVTISPTESAETRDSLVLMLSGHALATIFVISNAHADAILSEAASLKVKVERVASKSGEEGNSLVILGHEGDLLQAFLSTDKPASTTKNRSCKRQSQGRLYMLRAAAAAATVGVIGTWAALAFV